MGVEPSRETGCSSQIILRIVRRVQGSISFMVTAHQLWLFEQRYGRCSINDTKQINTKHKSRTEGVKVCAVVAEWVSVVQGLHFPV